MNYNTSPVEDKGHIEMQQELLKSLHQEISNRLFISGAVTEIVAAKQAEGKKPYGTNLNVEGTDLLDHTYAPAWAFRIENKGTPDERKIRTLRLAVTNEDPNKARGYVYYDLGELDEQGFLHMLPGVPEDPSWKVYAEAVELEKLRSGADDQPPTLPNLESSLMGISNPHTSYSHNPTKR